MTSLRPQWLEPVIVIVLVVVLVLVRTITMSRDPWPLTPDPWRPV
jgi:hypothetical protein